LDVSGETDGDPSDETSITAILRGAVHALATVFEYEGGELLIGSQSVVLIGGRGTAELGPQRGEAVSVSLL
jgi:hypothetical protein